MTGDWPIFRESDCAKWIAETWKWHYHYALFVQMSIEHVALRWWSREIERKEQITLNNCNLTLGKHVYIQRNTSSLIRFASAVHGNRFQQQLTKILTQNRKILHPNFFQIGNQFRFWSWLSCDVCGMTESKLNIHNFNFVLYLSELEWFFFPSSILNWLETFEYNQRLLSMQAHLSDGMQSMDERRKPSEYFLFHLYAFNSIYS